MSDSVISIEEIIAYSQDTFTGVIEDRNWGERSLFYNPECRLPKGTYSLTFKERWCELLCHRDSSRRLPSERWHFEGRVHRTVRCCGSETGGWRGGPDRA